MTWLIMPDHTSRASYLVIAAQTWRVVTWPSWWSIEGGGDAQPTVLTNRWGNDGAVDIYGASFMGQSVWTRPLLRVWRRPAHRSTSPVWLSFVNQFVKSLTHFDRCHSRSVICNHSLRLVRPHHSFMLRKKYYNAFCTDVSVYFVYYLTLKVFEMFALLFLDGVCVVGGVFCEVPGRSAGLRENLLFSRKVFMKCLKICLLTVMEGYSNRKKTKLR